MASPALHINKPNYSSTRIVSPLKVSIDTSAAVEIIETIYFDNSAAEESNTTRLIGTLLGTCSDDGNVTIKNAYIVPHKEEDGELIFEESHHFSTFQLYKRSNPELQVVGWFSTIDKLDMYTGLLHEFYSKFSPSNPQILLTLKYRNENNEIITPILKTYISGPVGLPASSYLSHSLGLDKTGAFAFVGIENEIIQSKSESTSLKYINKAVNNENLLTSITSNSELQQLETELKNISNLIQILSEYCSKVANGEIKGDEKVGQVLLSALKFKLSDNEINDLKLKLDTHINDTLLIEYLSSCIQQQLELSSKLTNFILPEDALK
ncbi:hypothetical protein DAPK24_046420 [Pichia kluyveri]|uniref:MPN domain-containing protein n=1 Tax=Pichia kluyveri TaxID=36015 RepID=A0AAV5R975_PICKL|nr:hypothetical protein DAPK24_046420 [Pichia kluyveri]